MTPCCDTQPKLVGEIKDNKIMRCYQCPNCGKEGARTSSPHEAAESWNGGCSDDTEEGNGMDVPMSDKEFDKKLRLQKQATGG